VGLAYLQRPGALPRPAHASPRLLRMSVHSPVEPLPEGLPVIHVSERTHELGKNYRTELAVHANVRETLNALLPLLQDLPREHPRLAELRGSNWSAQRERARTDAMRAADASPATAWPAVASGSRCPARWASASGSRAGR
jgi:benzoylformate decarboxylase